MHIEISTNGFDLTEPIADHVRARVEHTLTHQADRLTRVEAHLAENAAHKSSPDDKRCTLEARPKGLDPVAVTFEHANLYDAVNGAADKLKRALETRFGKLDHASHH